MSDQTPGANGPDSHPHDEETAPERDGDMGVSSERVGPTGPGQDGTSGTRDVGPGEQTGEAPPEQTPAAVTGEPEVNPDPPIPPRSGYNSYDPRSD